MPKTPIDEAPAGPEMDAAVAEALGYECVCDEEPLDCPIHCNDDPWTKRRYSTDIAAAWGLWELLSKQEPWSWALYSEGEEVAIEYYGEDYRGEREAGCGDWEREGKAPLAICRAFLKANGVEHVEVPE